jgi:hypothetical protein
VIVIKIHAWQSDRQWHGAWGDHDRRGLISRLRDVTDLRKPEMDLLVEGVRQQTCLQIPLAKAKNRYDALSILEFLSSLGAECSVEEISNPTT